jgi:hypothetical protein
VFVVSFPSKNFLEFPTKKFLVTYVRETLINEWYAQGLRLFKGTFIGLVVRKPGSLRNKIKTNAEIKQRRYIHNRDTYIRGSPSVGYVH